MYIHSLYLSGYKYHKFAEINDILIECKHKIQLIIGSNGSSKTKTVQQYSPKTITSTDFNKDGSKVLELEHNNHQYSISYDGIQKLHSFKEDGVELNTSGTSQVQEELVNNYLDYTKLTDKLIYNKMKMTQMTPAARMEFLTSINPINIKFIKDKHAKIYTQFKKLKAQLELLEKRSNEYTSTMMDDIEYSCYLADKEKIEEFDNFIY